MSQQPSPKRRRICLSSPRLARELMGFNSPSILSPPARTSSDLPRLQIAELDPTLQLRGFIVSSFSFSFRSFSFPFSFFILTSFTDSRRISRLPPPYRHNTPTPLPRAPFHHCTSITSLHCLLEPQSHPLPTPSNLLYNRIPSLPHRHSP